jgi:spermidine/putrescine transport system ATP-binding protein
MNDGRVEQLGTPREVYERPATKFVAGFIGTSNVLSGTVSRTDGDSAVIEPGPGERIVVPGGVSAGQEVELTVRPEKIDVRAGRPDGDGCALRGTVTEVVYLGMFTNYNVTTSTGAEVVVFVQNVSSADDVAVRGDGVWLSWDPRHSYVIGARP